ncbi:MAG: hypothetical protein J5706_03640 [Elusimicrobiales bacterium]|nr:hypothetical protein [Elusimicrobiales bacterium]
MKKTAISAVFLAAMAAAFFAMPSFAQTAQQKANEIKNAGQAAEQTQSATEARDINNAAWDGAEQGSGSSIDGKTIDIIGGDAPVPSQEEKPAFDVPESEDVTPWKNDLTAVFSSFTAAIALCLAASVLLATSTNKIIDNSPIKLRIAQAMFIAAAAACAVALAFATVIMVKHNQYQLGGIWAGAAAAAMATSISMAANCQSLWNKADEVSMSEIYASAAKKATILSFCLTVASGAAGGYASYNSYKALQKAEQDKQSINTQIPADFPTSINQFYRG